MNARTTFRAVLEIVLWWGGLTVLWIVLISSVDTLEWAVGASAALLGAVAARAARRAVIAR
ncbi:hypothetical protein ACFYZJ_19265 [Streptomyces sp. NPDC001848]|uniref:hypothetical protein n=1 Tax=Streptomyces sp. NPDC001848 TaxID=3364618 RepID=UPI0036C18F48